jgi:hypothetical protein
MTVFVAPGERGTPLNGQPPRGRAFVARRRIVTEDILKEVSNMYTPGARKISRILAALIVVRLSLSPSLFIPT